MNSFWLAVLAAAAAAAPPTVKYGIRVQPGPMDTVLLKDYAPESSVVVPETKVDKARFAVIDVHAHASMCGIRTEKDVFVPVRDGTRLCVNIYRPDAGGLVPVRQVAPGRYAACLDWRGAGRLLIVERLPGRPPTDRVVLRRTLAAPLPAEMFHLTPMPGELDRLARRSGGRLLADADDLAELSAALAARKRPQPIDLWPGLLVLAVLLWLLDAVAARAGGRRQAAVRQ